MAAPNSTSSKNISIIIPYQTEETFDRDPVFADWWDDSPLFSIMKKDPPEEQAEEIKEGEGAYKFIMNVHHFHPNELTIRTTIDGHGLMIVGQHEEKSEPLHGLVTRQFKRRFTLPPDVQLDKAEAQLSTDGVLQLVVPKGIIPEQLSAAEEKMDTAAASQVEVLEGDNDSIVGKAKNLLPDFHFEPFWDRFGSYTLPKMFGVQSGMDTFKITVDVKHFTEEELKVFCTEHYVRVEGEHADKHDAHGVISRKYGRIYDLPTSVNPDDLTCRLTSYGVLEIEAPRCKPRLPKSKVEKVLPITLAAAE